nr:hypothetical protein [Halapricum sp. CBA1109]
MSTGIRPAAVPYREHISMARYGTVVEDGTVYVESGDGPIEIGPVDRIVAAVGGPAWTITYSEADKQAHPGMDTSDEGLTVDVVDMLRTMTHSERFVETLATHPAELDDDGPEAMPPRMGLFVGKLLENLENGLS